MTLTATVRVASLWPMRFMEDLFAKVLLQEALDVVSEVELQKLVVPSDSQYSDVYCEPRPQRPPKQEVPYLGVLWEMTQTICTFEPFSQTPSSDPTRQPLLEILSELIYLTRVKLKSAEPLTEPESANMTELRREFEAFKASLRLEGEAKGKAEGKAEGESKGRVEGKAEALLAVLTARGVEVPEVVKQKILACRDLATLDRLLVQAATATSPDDVLIAAA
jgi:hypothetical protein